MTVETVVAQTGVVMPCSGSGWKARTTAKNASQPPARRTPGMRGRPRRAAGDAEPGSPKAGTVQSSSSACSSSVRSRVVGTMAYLPRVAFNLG